MESKIKLSSVKKESSSFFVFSEKKLERNFRALQSAIREHCGESAICYSYKTNYIPGIVSVFHRLGALAEVVSGTELRLAMQLGVSGRNIVFNGPFKDTDSLALALREECLINIDSVEELSSLEVLIRSRSLPPPRIGIRVMFQQDTDVSSRFGIDPFASAFSDVLRRVLYLNGGHLESLHCHLPSRGVTYWKSRVRQMRDVLRSISDVSIRSINLGGGMAGRMPRSLYSQFGAPPPSFSDYAKILGEFITTYRSGRSHKTQLMIEPGTALVADTGFYYCRVISIKDLPSHSLVFVAGSAQCIGSIGSSLSYRARAQPTDSESRRERKLIGAKVVGYTCIERDVLNHNFNGRVAVGDYLCFTNVGSYSVVMKPQFIQLAPPVYLLRSNGDISTLRRAETLSDLTTTYLLQGI